MQVDWGKCGRLQTSFERSLEEQRRIFTEELGEVFPVKGIDAIKRKDFYDR
jgi:hypothetical protein